MRTNPSSRDKSSWAGHRSYRVCTSGLWSQDKSHENFTPHGGYQQRNLEFLDAMAASNIGACCGRCVGEGINTRFSGEDMGQVVVWGCKEIFGQNAESLDGRVTTYSLAWI